MSESKRVAPGWSIGPDWNFTSEDTEGEEGFGRTNGGEGYYYYTLKKPKADAQAAVSVNSLTVDWSQKAVDSHNLDLKAASILAETKRIFNLKEK